jgi:hypothetical protein
VRQEQDGLRCSLASVVLDEVVCGHVEYCRKKIETLQ